jgi:hypothetical protein
MTWMEPFSDVRVAVEGPTQTFFASWLAHLLAKDLSGERTPSPHNR